MYDFEIIPDDNTDNRVKLFAPDGAETLVIARRLGCFRADVLRNGEYLYSICKFGRDDPYWCIVQRRQPERYTELG